MQANVCVFSDLSWSETSRHSVSDLRMSRFRKRFIFSCWKERARDKETWKQANPTGEENLLPHERQGHQEPPHVTRETRRPNRRNHKAQENVFMAVILE